MYTKTITKVPGRLLEPNNKRQGYIGDLSLQTTTQLKELLERQLKLLANKSFINKLEDKGQKIMKLKESIEEEIKKRNDKNNSLTNMMSALKLQDDMNNLEWSGKCAPRSVHQEDTEHEDDKNVLKMLATHSGAGFHIKKYKVIKPEESFIKPSDLVYANDSAISKGTEEEPLEKYAQHLCEKLDSKEISTDCITQAKFLPHKTLNTLSSNKKELRKPKSYWEVTAATPPTAVHGDTKMVTLQESIKLQREQQQQLKEIQMRHASERLVLSQHHSSTVGSSLRALRDPGSYRDPAFSSSSDDENNEQDIEVNDNEDQDIGSVVVYNLVDDTSNE